MLRPASYKPYARLAHEEMHNTRPKDAPIQAPIFEPLFSAVYGLSDRKQCCNIEYHTLVRLLPKDSWQTKWTAYIIHTDLVSSI